MERIDPYIHTLEDALACIESYGRPHAFYYTDAIESFGLDGGSLKHPTTISLIHSIAVNHSFGHYHEYDCWRLVIKDGGYRTLYRMDDDEFQAIKVQLLEWCREHQLSIRASSRVDVVETIQCRALEFFGDWAQRVHIRVQPPRPVSTPMPATEVEA